MLSQFEFNKKLPDDVTKAIGQLESLFQQIFRQISYFQDNLNRQHGKAASALKRNLNRHLELMSKSAPTLLNFTDVMKSFLATIVSIDEGNAGFVMATGRAAWQYSLSTERIDEEIKLDANTMKEAAASFQENLANMEELFAEFNTLLNEVMAESHIPWDDFSSVWSEAQQRVRAITEETKSHIEKLVRQTNLFVQELNRLDHMAAQLKISV